MFGIFLPNLLKKQTRCSRCNMHYYAKLDNCPRCEDIADGPALERHIEEHQQQLKANHSLGTTFIWIAVLMLAILLITLYN